MIARIQDAGLYRCDASAMNAANESAAEPPSRGVICDAGSALSARSATAIEDITAVTTSAAVPLRHDEIEAVSMMQAITGEGAKDWCRQRRPIDGISTYWRHVQGWKGKDALQERHAFGQITAIGKQRVSRR
jgi:hypothetical protein